VPKAIEAVGKVESTRLIAAIARVTHDLEVAEELAQEKGNGTGVYPIRGASRDFPAVNGCRLRSVCRSFLSVFSSEKGPGLAVSLRGTTRFASCGVIPRYGGDTKQ
jgi:hypothetical protein